MSAGQTGPDAEGQAPESPDFAQDTDGGQPQGDGSAPASIHDTGQHAPAEASATRIPQEHGQPDAGGPSLTWDMSAFGPHQAAPPEPSAPAEGLVRLATILPVSRFDVGDGLVITHHGTDVTPEQAKTALTAALRAGVRLKETTT